MDQKKLKYIGTGFMGVTLIIAMSLGNIYPKYAYYFIELFIIINMIKDIILYKKGVIYDKVGIREMIVAYIILLIFFVTYHIYSIG